MIDGNFTADHLKTRRPENDIRLTPGGGYMVEPTRYEDHLKEAIDYQEASSLFKYVLQYKLIICPQKSTCSDHKAVNRVNNTQKHLQATGIGATACARHGCFFPQSVVDFQKGERSGLNHRERPLLMLNPGK